MATIYVDSNAAGANDGTSWTDAFTSINGLSLAAGDVVRVASDHSQTGVVDAGQSAAVDGVTFISTNKADDTYQAGATITCANIAMSVWRGFTINCTSDLKQAYQNLPATFIDCSINPNSSIWFVNEEVVTFINCTLFQSGSRSYHFYQRNGPTFFIGGSILGNPTFNFYNATSDRTTIILMKGVDLSSFNPTKLFTTPEHSNQVVLDGCKLPASMFDLIDAYNRGQYVKLINCYTAAPGGARLTGTSETNRLISELSTTVYRTGGASQEGVGFSWNMQRQSGGSFSGDSIGGAIADTPFLAWVEGGSPVTIDLHIIHDGNGSGTGGDLTNKEFAAILTGPPESGNAQGYASMKPDLTPVAADLAASTATWTGTAFTNKQKISWTYTPAVAGYVEVRPTMAVGAAREIFVCPKLDIS